MLALDLIRRKAEAQGHALGPILVLSYKNHALDEFLNDVITQYDASMGSGSYSYLRPGMLIRTGKPDIESLERYTEKHSPLEYQARNNLEHILHVQRTARFVIKELLDCAVKLEVSSIEK